MHCLMAHGANHIKRLIDAIFHWFVRSLAAIQIRKYLFMTNANHEKLMSERCSAGWKKTARRQHQW